MGDQAVANDLVNRDKDLEALRLRLERDRTKLQAQLASREHDLARLQNDVAVAEARLRSLEQPVDAERLRIAELRLQQAQANLASRQDAVQRNQALLELGAVSPQQVQNARLSAIDGEMAVRNAERSLLELQQGTDPLVLERARLRLADLQRQVGTDGERKTGMIQEIAALKDRLKREVAKHQAREKRLVRQRHDALSAMYDHSPVAWLKITQEDSAILDLDFSDGGTEAWADDRDHGWSQDMSEALQRRRRVSGAEKHVVVVRGAAWWRCRLKPGRYQLEMLLVSSDAWNGVRVAIGDHCVLSRNHLAPGKKVRIQEEVVIAEDGQLTISFSDPAGPAMRAPADGVVTVQHWVKLGWHSWRGINWPWLFFNDVNKLQVNSRVPADLVDLLKPAAEDDAARQHDDPIAQLAQQLGQPLITVIRARGEQATATMKELGSQPVHWSNEPLSWWARDNEDPRDLLARELKLTANDLALVPGEKVAIEFALTIPPEVTAIPLHRLSGAGRPPQIEVDGQRQTLHGLRFGGYFLTAQQLPAAWQVVVEGGEQHMRHRGSIIPGRTTVVSSAGGGRIQRIVEDGSQVSRGQEIVYLRDPGIEARKAENEERRRRARQDFLLLVEERRIKTAAALRAHAGKVAAEHFARLDLEQASHGDPDTLARRQATLAQRQRRLQQRQDHVSALANMTDTSEADRRQASWQLARAEINQYRARLDVVAAGRQINWLSLQQADAAWRQAVADLSQRDASLAEAQLEEQVARITAETRLQHALEGSRREREFEKVRQVVAPVDGRIFFRKGWNDHSRSVETIDENFIVWRGFQLADILDTTELAVEAIVPQKYFGNIQLGQQATVGFDIPGAETVQGTITRLGSRFTNSDDATESEILAGFGPQFSRYCFLYAASRLAERLTPGSGAWIRIEP